MTKVFATLIYCLLAVAAEGQGGYVHARPTASPTALDVYLAKEDPNFSWRLAQTSREEGLTLFSLEMVSQQWRSGLEVTQPLWRHTLVICVPDVMERETALLSLDGGLDDDADVPPGERWGLFKTTARNTKSVTATIFKIPNQPLYFSDMKAWPRFEDSLMAYAWDKFYRSGDAEWSLCLPMTKAAVRAMDAIQSFCASPEGGGHSINNFVVTGVSKRGWAAWLTAIVDKRVSAVVPVSIDPMRLTAATKHHWAVYGRWSMAFGDYVAMGITNWLDTPENEALSAFEDPYNYLDRLVLPKFVLIGGNDQFMTPDSTLPLWDGLPGPKWLRYVPNEGHGLFDAGPPSVDATYTAYVTGTPMPQYSFSHESDGSIVVKLEPSANGETLQPESVKLWQAHNPDARDVRGSTAKYEPMELEATAPGVYRATVQPRTPGYTFYFVELTYAGPRPDSPLRFTTTCRVLPEETPFKYVPPVNPPRGFLSKGSVAQP